MLGVSNTMAHYNNKVCNFKGPTLGKKKTAFTNVSSLSVRGKSPSFTSFAGSTLKRVCALKLTVLERVPL